MVVAEAMEEVAVEAMVVVDGRQEEEVVVSKHLPIPQLIGKLNVISLLQVDMEAVAMEGVVEVIIDISLFSNDQQKIIPLFDLIIIGTRLLNIL